MRATADLLLWSCIVRKLYKRNQFCKGIRGGVAVAGPLAGIKVVELGVWVPGPSPAASWPTGGADVVKIEPPAGDSARMFGRMLGIEGGVTPPFEMDNRGKRSIMLVSHDR
jgi:hypothetical protein